jgi:hypothetical protein
MKIVNQRVLLALAMGGNPLPCEMFYTFHEAEDHALKVERWKHLSPVKAARVLQKKTFGIHAADAAYHTGLANPISDAWRRGC